VAAGFPFGVDTQFWQLHIFVVKPDPVKSSKEIPNATEIKVKCLEHHIEYRQVDPK
jgi:hypothetical protein